ncbi:hypothetical protein AVEN_7761-1 [Araneus ventricosus]|uniref:DDE-1 domain-containing protein n=1 Tax=Araneus ventricosus TaxID=182803 RepID=A0A4Y2G0Q4_ARAVE|nr:hypothetical protein AVEN_7761-1 [Araneus ventricosus]
MRSANINCRSVPNFRFNWLKKGVQIAYSIFFFLHIGEYPPFALWCVKGNSLGAIALPPGMRSAIVVRADGSQYHLFNVAPPAGIQANTANSPNTTYRLQSLSDMMTETFSVPMRLASFNVSFRTRPYVLKVKYVVAGKFQESGSLLLCCNMLGDFETPVVIGKAKKPRYFKNIVEQKLSVSWKSNKKAWLTT